MHHRFVARAGSATHRSRVMAVAACVAVLGLFTFPGRARAQEHASLDGLWDAIVVSNGTEIPFRFEIATKGPEVQGFFFEGDRKIGSTLGSFAEGVLTLEYDFLNTTLALTQSGEQLTGTYKNNRPNARPQEVRMR